MRDPSTHIWDENNETPETEEETVDDTSSDDAGNDSEEAEENG